MTIERTMQLSPIAASQQDSTTRHSQLPVTGPGSDTATQVRLSQITQQVITDTSQDVDMSRVEQIKSQIAQGRFSIDTDVIASRLIDNIFDY